jgi:RimJ/RimL family protein N-acetyltransferase
MNGDLFRGELVRLTAEEPELLGKAVSSWDRDSEFRRLLDDEPPCLWSAKKIQSWFEKDSQEQDEEGFQFLIRTLQDDRLIGFVGLWDLERNHGDAEVGIGIGDRQSWGRGYGTDAMRVILRYGFTELNLKRITLGVFDYNTRAIRSYEKAGFTLEGRMRKAVYRDGSRADIVYMGILREEWQALNGLRLDG